jgi:hypothetical protein
MIEPDRHKIRVEANMHGRGTEVWLDDKRLHDLMEFNFNVSTDSLTLVTITLQAADVTIDSIPMTEYFKVLAPTEPATWWQKLIARFW